MSSPEVRRPAQLLREIIWNYRSQLHDRVVPPPLHTPGTRNHAGLVQRELRSVEEEHLPDLRIKRIHVERDGALREIRVRNGELELDAVGLFDEAEQLDELVVRELGCGGGGHAVTFPHRGGMMQSAR